MSAGPTLSALPLARLRAAKRRIVSRAIDHYGAGCDAGYERARRWLDNPHRGDPAAGGTMAAHLVEMAKQLAAAATGPEVRRASGEIAAFAYTVECPEDAEALAERRAARKARGAA